MTSAIATPLTFDPAEPAATVSPEPHPRIEVGSRAVEKLRALRQATAADRGDPSCDAGQLAEASSCLWGLGRNRTAVRLLQKAARDPARLGWSVFRLWADILTDSGAFEEARRVLAQAAGIWPAEAALHEALGTVSAWAHDYPAAQGHFERALALAPERIACRLGLADVLAVLLEHDAEVELMEETRRTVGPEHPQAQSLESRLNRAAERRARWKEARETFAAYAADSADGFAKQFEAVGICLDERRFDVAWAGLAHLLRNHPDKFSAWSFGCRLGVALGNFAGAYHLLTESWKRFPDNEAAYFMAERALLQAGRYADARRFHSAAPPAVRRKAAYLKDGVRISSALGLRAEERGFLEAAASLTPANAAEAEILSILRCRAAAFHTREGRTIEAATAGEHSAALCSRHAGRMRAAAATGTTVHVAPFQRWRQDPLRIALCLSGQLRGFRATFPSVRDAILGDRRTEVDVFVHTWRQIGHGAGVHEEISRCLPAEVAEILPRECLDDTGFRAAFPRVHALLQRDAAVDPDELADLLPLADCVIEDDETFAERFSFVNAASSERHKNSLRMFYKIRACDGLRRRREARHRIRYDLVVRMRPDAPVLSWNPDEIHELTRDGHSICAEYAVEDGFGDRFACGRPEIMAVYADLWDVIRNAGSLDALPGCSGVYAEPVLLNHLLARGIGMRQTRRTQFGRLTNSQPAAPQLLDAFLLDLRTRDAGPLAHRVLRCLADLSAAEIAAAKGPEEARLYLKALEADEEFSARAGCPDPAMDLRTAGRRDRL